MRLWIVITLVICCVVSAVEEFLPERIRLPRKFDLWFRMAAAILALYWAWEIIQERRDRVFAEVARDGTVLTSRNFPWRVERGTDAESNTIYTIFDKEGDLSLVAVKAKTPVKYEVYKAWAGTTIKFACPADSLPARFTVEVQR